MTILGVESVVFGVADVAEHTRFWTDFGLSAESASATETVFRLPSGSRVIVLAHGDARLPSPDPLSGMASRKPCGAWTRPKTWSGSPPAWPAKWR
jgi:hypothetical protein